MANTAVEFPKWISTTAPTWIWTWPHQELLYSELERVTRGETKRLMIFMPPRHSKSETVTVRYTAWRLINRPNMNVILGSYNQRLANRFSRKIKRIVSAETAISKERRAVDEWETSAGGSLCAVGVGGGVTGFGANLIVIDDPVKNRAFAESRARRESAWDWFNDDIFTRLEPNGAMILIQTRWHEDDLAGRLIDEGRHGGERWRIISLPAFSEGSSDLLGRRAGEALCPDRFDAARLREIEKKIGTYSFASLYQQRPIPAAGGIFKREWFDRVVARAPSGLRWYRGYDLAVSTHTSADYTASFRIAIDEKDDIYIADGFRDRMEFPEQRRYLIERMTTEKDTQHCVESALHGRALVQDVMRDVRSKRVVLRSVKPEKDKLTRALPWAAKAEQGKVILVEGPWIRGFLDEVCSFPASAHDDQIDAVSLAYQLAHTAGKHRSGGW